MNDLKKISKIFLLKSKSLSISCICSVLIAVVLIISMFNLSSNAFTSYRDKLLAAYGDCDALITYEDYSGIQKSVLDQIKNLRGIEKCAAGYFNSNFRIIDNSVYLVGSDNTELMKSRYHYNTDIKRNEVAMNTVLAGCLQCNLQDNITINGDIYRVKEIFEDTTGSATGITMAIFNEKALPQLLDEKPDYNFVLISVHDYYRIESLVKEISQIDTMLSINTIEVDEFYKESIESFSIFIISLSICVIVVTGLFVTSNIKRFIYKYQHDLAIIRALGGNKKQIQLIFRYIIICINLIGCAGGFIMSILLNKIILSGINDKIQLIEGHIRFFFFKSFMIAVSGFLILVFLLYISIQKNFKILPLEAIMNNELNKIGKRKSKLHRTNSYWIGRLFRRDGYIVIKSLLIKFKDNILITGTIMLITVISFIGSGLTNIIQNNNNHYLREQYLSDIVVTSSNHTLFKNFANYYERLQNTDGIDASVVLFPKSDAALSNEPLNYMIADFNALERQGIVRNSVKEGKRIILNEKTAKKFGVSIGDTISVLTPPVYAYDSNGLIIGTSIKPYEVRMIITDILTGSSLQNTDAYIDIQCDDFMQEDYALNRIFVSGDLDVAEQILNQMKSINTGLKWMSYDRVIEASNKAIKERFFIFQVVIGILVLIAGLGWYHAIRQTIISGKEQYNIMRIHGMSIRRVRKMLLIHIFLYLFTGVGSGIILGTISLAYITYWESGTSIVSIDFRTLAYLIGFMILLSILLIPDVVKISKTKVLDIEI